MEESERVGEIWVLRILKTNQLKLSSRTKPHTLEKLLEGEYKLICAGIRETKGKRKVRERNRDRRAQKLQDYNFYVTF